MSITNTPIAFYVIKNDNSHWSLFNSLTDKLIFSKVSMSTIIFFLEANAPSHPFIQNHVVRSETTTFTYSDIPTLWTSNQTIYPYTTPYSVSDNNQLSFDFMFDSPAASEPEVKDNEIPEVKPTLTSKKSTLDEYLDIDSAPFLSDWEGK